MASVRASVVNQARRAATRMGSRPPDTVDDRVVDQIVRCARLAPDAATTLEWALDTLNARAASGPDEVACQLLQAARQRLDTHRSGVAVDLAAGTATTP